MRLWWHLISAPGICLICFIFDPCPSYASPWMQPQGRLQLFSNTSWYTTDRYYTAEGLRLGQDRFTKFSFTPYFEYGWRDRVTLGASLETAKLRQNDPFFGITSVNQGVGDLEIFARTPLWSNDRAILSVQPLLKTPRMGSAGVFPVIGSDFWAAELRLLGGINYGIAAIDGTRPYFTCAELAYRARMEGAADQLRADITAGWHATRRWMALGQYFVTQNIGAYGPPESYITPEANYSLHTLQLSAVYALQDNLQLQLGVFRHVWARNTGGGNGVLLSVWKTF